MSEYIPKYKTEMCKNIEVYEWCPYGEECIFAHSKSEMVGISGFKYKRTKCKRFGDGYCNYGLRCLFKHWVKPRNMYWRRKLNMMTLNIESNIFKNNVSLINKL